MFFLFYAFILGKVFYRQSTHPEDFNQIIKDLVKAGFVEADLRRVLLTENDLEEAREEIHLDLTTPFIFFCAEGKTNC